MTDQEQQEAVVAGIRRRLARHRQWLRRGPPSLGGQLAHVGVLGWVIVTPILLGAWVGRVLDRITGGGIFWSGGLITVGVALGSWSAWKWMQSR